MPNASSLPSFLLWGVGISTGRSARARASRSGRRRNTSANKPSSINPARVSADDSASTTYIIDTHSDVRAHVRWTTARAWSPFTRHATLRSATRLSRRPGCSADWQWSEPISYCSFAVMGMSIATHLLLTCSSGKIRPSMGHGGPDYQLPRPLHTVA